MTARSLRVYFVPHGAGAQRRLSGVLLRDGETAEPTRPPSAIGATEDEVLADLEQELLQRFATSRDRVESYLWEEPFTVHEVDVVVHPRSSIKQRPIIGAQKIPLRLAYAACPMKGGGHRVFLPRFGGSFVLEELALAPEVLRQAVASYLLAAEAQELYDFRFEGHEYVRVWQPALLDRLPPDPTDDPDAAEFPALTSVAEDLVRLAGRNKLPAVVGESAELERLLRSRPRSGQPPSILIVGAPGVGKTTLVHRLARAFLRAGRGKDAPRQPRIWSTNADKILAGMVYLGMWQERCLAIIREIEREGDYLYVGPLAPILRAQPDGTSIAEMLEPPLAAGQLSLLAECTPSELERAQRTAPSFVARFSVVRLAELSPTAVLALVDPWIGKRRAHPIHHAAQKRLVELLGAFVKHEVFPGKLFRFLEWLAADAADRRRQRAALPTASDAPDGDASNLATDGGDEASAPAAAAEIGDPEMGFGPRDLTAAFSRWSGIPMTILSDDVAADSDHFAGLLRARVIGQDAACQACGRVLARFKAGLQDPARPTASLLFIGPTGVGKTELAKQLARVMFGDTRRLVRVDMSEYATPWSVSRLIDVSPGQRSLARAVAEQPLSVVLLDEIEKAHPLVFDVLLGLLGEGRLTDASGRLVDFRGAVVIMTSNLGATDRTRVSFGGGSAADFSRAVRDHFRPELKNRIDQVVVFRSLTEDDVVRIVELELAAVAERAGLVRRGISLRVSEEAKRVLARLGHDPTRGARTLRRAVEERVVVPIAAELAGQPARRGGEIELSVENEALVVRV